MSDYTMSDVKEADRLWDEMSLRDIAERTDPSLRTLGRWASKGLISTDTDHRSKYDEDTVKRADDLWEVMPLSQISEVLDVTYSALREWSKAGRITTSQTWKGYGGGHDAEVPTDMIAEAYYKADDVTHKDVAEQFGITASTVNYHLRKYRSKDR